MPPKKKEESEVKGAFVGVRCNAQEYKIVHEKAVAHGLKPATFLRNLALNYPITTTVDTAAYLELMKARGDLGRLGGLFKLYLSDKAYDGNKNKQLLNKLLVEIELAKATLLEQAKRIKK